MSDTCTMTWQDVCAIDEITPGTGVSALVQGKQIALFRLAERVYALSNLDPFSGAPVLARGILGDKAGVAKVASPLFKQNFCLATGVCLEQPEVRIDTWPARIHQGRVEIQIGD